jgi:hypothetical protein
MRMLQRTGGINILPAVYRLVWIPLNLLAEYITLSIL